MALNASNSNNMEQLAVKGLISGRRLSVTHTLMSVLTLSVDIADSDR